MTGVDHFVLAQLITVAGLVAATAEYSVIIRRRVERRRREERSYVEAVGLQGLVRVMLVDR